MAKRPHVRLLEVTVTAQEPALWKWHISESDIEVMHGFEASRESAQIEGDTVLFKLLVKPARLTHMYGPAVRCKWILPSWR